MVLLCFDGILCPFRLIHTSSTSLPILRNAWLGWWEHLQPQSPKSFGCLFPQQAVPAVLLMEGEVYFGEYFGVCSAERSGCGSTLVGTDTSEMDSGANLTRHI